MGLSQINGVICTFFLPRVFNDPASGFWLEFCNGGGLKNRMILPPDRQQSVTICLFVWTQYPHCQKDGQTDRRTELLKQYRALQALHADMRWQEKWTLIFPYIFIKCTPIYVIYDKYVNVCCVAVVWFQPVCVDWFVRSPERRSIPVGWRFKRHIRILGWR